MDGDVPCDALPAVVQGTLGAAVEFKIFDEFVRRTMISFEHDMRAFRELALELIDRGPDRGDTWDKVRNVRHWPEAAYGLNLWQAFFKNGGGPERTLELDTFCESRLPETEGELLDLLEAENAPCTIAVLLFSKMLAVSLTQRIATECCLYKRKKHGSGLLLPGCAKRFFPQPAVSTAMQPSFESEHALPHAARALRLQRRRHRHSRSAVGECRGLDGL